MLIRFHPEADIEFHEALEWYALQKLGLDTEFMRCVDEAISRIIANPEMFPIALRNTRKAMVKRLPYTLYYQIGDKEIMILAVFHGKRSPSHWRKRI
jgi:plasmid stabilization system protein ParE